jgi:hypothetical protein
MHPPLQKADIHYVRCPSQVVSGGHEFSLVGSGSAQRRFQPLAPCAIALQRAEAVFPNEMGHRILAARLVRPPRSGEDPRRPIDALARGSRWPEQTRQSGAVHRPRLLRAFQPLIVPTEYDVRLPIHHLYGKFLPVGLDERMLLPGTC